MIKHARRALAALLAAGTLATTMVAGETLAHAGPAGHVPAGHVRVAGETGASSVRIMPLGDSITYGVGSPSLDSYRSDLYRRLTAAGVAVDFVGSQRSGTGPDRDNEGHPGWTVAQLAARVDGWLAEYEPDVVLLHIGTNDMHVGNFRAATELAGLLDQIHAARPAAEILVAKVIGLGTTSHTGGQVARTAEFNRLVERMVARRGAPFRLVDHSGIRGIDMFDRVHPNDFGFRRMSWNWYRALEPVLNTDNGAWPGTDPNLVSSAQHCLSRITTYPTAMKGCKLWFRRLPAGAVTSRVWQFPVRHTVKVNGRLQSRIRWVTG